jgi:phage terminase large subunit-like protein
VHIYADRIESTSGNVLRVEASDVSSSWGKRPDWVCCDELVEWRRPELWQAIWSATGKRPRSRVIVITTSGSPAGGHAPGEEIMARPHQRPLK